MHDAVTDWQELSALYEKADQLSGAALEAWLASLREPPHPLLEQLLQMLGARSEIRDNGFLDALPLLTMATSETAAAVGAGEWRPGARIGPYRLEGRLGAGGMAEVWRAQRDDGAFQRTVAIKLLFRHVGGPRQQESFAQRFDRERDILASLDHPNIAALHDAGVTPSGQPWLALEYVEGEPLTDWCDRARLGVRGRVELYLQVLLAVQHAHANLIIHRDLKPANILVTTAGQVRLLDFGIAKLMEAGGDALADTELTRHAGRMMTVRYASPEQLTGQPLTTACDVYSLGVVLYELLCGHLPYEPKVNTPAQVEQAVIEVEPRPPSRRAVTRAAAVARGSSDGPALRRALGTELDAVVLRSLAKRPSARYASAEALRVELERWLAGEPVEARAPTRAYRLRKFVGRHVLGVSLGASAVLALMVVATAAVWLGLQARQESARATAARDFMMGMFKQADSDKAHGADMTARQLLDRGREDVLTRLNGQPELQADLLEGIAGIQSGMEEFTKANVTFEKLVDLYDRLGQRFKAAVATAAQADNAHRMADNQLAHKLILKARQQAAVLPMNIDLLSSLDLVEGWVAVSEGDPLHAQQLFKGVEKRRESAFGPLDRKTLDALMGQVLALVGMKEYEAAIATESVFEARSRIAPDRTTRELMGVDVGYAELLYRAGRYRDAAERSRSSIQGCVAALGVNDSWCRRLMYDEAASWFRLGFFERAKKHSSALKAMADDGFSPELQLHAQLLLLELSAQPSDNAVDSVSAQSAAALATDATVEADPARKIQVLGVLAQAALRRNRLNEAQSWLDQALALRSGVGERRAELAAGAKIQALIGIVRLRQGLPVEARAALELALHDQASAVGADHPSTVLTSLDMAQVLRSLGEYKAALAIVQGAESVLVLPFGTDAPVVEQVRILRAALEREAGVQSPSADRSLAVASSSADYFFVP